MTDKPDTGGKGQPAPRPQEPDVVRTTIVGGRPPAKGRGVAGIPRGMEVLVKKASVDDAFRALLLEKRDAAAAEIGLELDPAEVVMLRAVSAEQLAGIIAGTKVEPASRRAFLGKVAAAMLVAIGASQAGCTPAVTGSRPSDPEGGKEGNKGGKQSKTQPAPPAPTGIRPDPPSQGVRPDRLPVTDGIRPDRPPATKGIRPDPPEPPPPPPPPPTRGIQPDRP